MAETQTVPYQSVTLKTESIGTQFWNPPVESIPTSHRRISESVYSPRSDSLARLTLRVAVHHPHEVNAFEEINAGLWRVTL